MKYRLSDICEIDLFYSLKTIDKTLMICRSLIICLFNQISFNEMFISIFRNKLLLNISMKREGENTWEMEEMYSFNV